MNGKERNKIIDRLDEVFVLDSALISETPMKMRELACKINDIIMLMNETGTKVECPGCGAPLRFFERCRYCGE